MTSHRLPGRGRVDHARPVRFSFDGKAYQVSDDAPVGYSVKAGGKPRRVSERPSCG